MGIGQQLGGMPNDKMTYQELIDHVANLQKTIEYYLGGNIDSDNAREFGGWQIKKDVLQSKDGDVGLSTADGGIDPDPVRVWAGDIDKDSSPFQVRASGKVIANDLQVNSGAFKVFNPATPNRRLEIVPSNIDGVPDMSFWNEVSTTLPRGSIYVTTGNFNGDGTHNYFSILAPDRMQISSNYVWFNAGTIDFDGATVLGLNTTAVFG